MSTANHAVSPTPALLNWLEETSTGASPRPLFRLPVYVEFGDEYRLDYGRVVVGTSMGTTGDADKDTSLHLDLDDGGMMNPLLERLAATCPKGETGCAFFMDGHWGPLVDVPMPPMPVQPGAPTRHTFAVLKLGALITDPTTNILVERL